jgi:TIR domain-containing protein
MANIFISYSRQNESIARTLADDMKTLGHTMWFDQELSGGQVWWNQILAAIRNCDVFVFVLAPETLNSIACKREYGYAAVLGKPILPIQVSGGVSTNLLPTELSRIQFVDYRHQDREAALWLARALMAVPRPEPLPDPLPPPPEVPISYLARLTEQVDTTSTLSYGEQSALVGDLKRGLRDPVTIHDARTLLERLRKRRDLFAAIADEIDELLNRTRTASSGASAPQLTQNVKEPFVKSPPETGREPPRAKITPPPTTQPTLTATHPKMMLVERLTCAVVGGF